MRSWIVWLGLLVVSATLLPWQCAVHDQQGVRFDPTAAPEKLLSAYGFFREDMAKQLPAEWVIPYDLISPLFSDYAEKKRFVYVPPGHSLEYDSLEVFNFPVGSALIKTFYYVSPEGSERLMETRLLLRREQGWDALPYRWNDSGTDAVLSVAGGRAEVHAVHSSGEPFSVDYVIPNKNQCKGCHSFNGKLEPIGPKARNLNRSIAFNQVEINQLMLWHQMGLLEDLPSENKLPRLSDYRDESASLSDRALAYLEINCGHCHRPEGPANNSGLHLTTLERDPAHLGIDKAPVAAGKGSGGLEVDISPGHPEQSILLYRMKHQDPGIRMPELGRQVMHTEGVNLISDWIASLPEGLKGDK